MAYMRLYQEESTLTEQKLRVCFFNTSRGSCTADLEPLASEEEEEVEEEEGDEEEASNEWLRRRASPSSYIEYCVLSDPC